MCVAGSRALKQSGVPTLLVNTATFSVYLVRVWCEFGCSMMRTLLGFVLIVSEQRVSCDTYGNFVIRAIASIDGTLIASSRQFTERCCN